LAINEDQVDQFKKKASEVELDYWFVGKALDGAGIEVVTGTAG
jgi:hypothetical protein